MKFLVVDDHALIREAMRGVLKELQGDALILEAASSDQAMDTMQQHPDLALVLLDLKLPDRDGIEVLGELRERYPATSIVMLSAFNDRDNVVRALDNGALGFIPEDGLARRAARRTEAHSCGRHLHSPRSLDPRACWQPPRQASRRLRSGLHRQSSALRKGRSTSWR